jgi:Flp pilus assembly protein TadD
MSFKQSFPQNVPDPAAHPFAEATAHHRAGRFTEAERLYRLTLELAPRHGDASRLLGSIYLHAGKPEQALPLFHVALQAQPKNPEILDVWPSHFRIQDAAKKQ